MKSSISSSSSGSGRLRNLNSLDHLRARLRGDQPDQQDGKKDTNWCQDGGEEAGVEMSLLAHVVGIVVLLEPEVSGWYYFKFR
jgi:hypothetical protein